MRRYVIFGLGATALSLILKRLYYPKTEETQAKSLSTNPETPDSATITYIATKSETAIWSLLQQGKGYVILMRHALAPGIGDPPDFRLNDCATQRNLSDEGRKQAIKIGKTFKNRNILVSRVLSSQWCRCLETAKLLNLGKVRPFPILNSFFSNYTTASKQTAQLRQFILNNRSTPGVIVMVTHEVNITNLVGNIYPKSGESMVLRANDKNKIEVLGQIQAV
ncbi:MAG: histidine phosphatase family protein [Goleter apudmare HA4340-LM2]|jgi:phosphohistidine phosphatase SixA|nr:histidine phosphatase family protein [Goleter apudmare HA4340-LM2]